MSTSIFAFGRLGSILETHLKASSSLFNTFTSYLTNPKLDYVDA